MSEKYRVIDLQTDEVVSTDLDIDDLRMMLNDIFWQEGEPEFSNADYDEVYYTLLNCEYKIEEMEG